MIRGSPDPFPIFEGGVRLRQTSLGTQAFPVYAVRYFHAHAQNVIVCAWHAIAEFTHTQLHSARARENNKPHKRGRPGFRGYIAQHSPVKTPRALVMRARQNSFWHSRCTTPFKGIFLSPNFPTIFRSICMAKFRGISFLSA